jgi:hypothetical protein
MSNLFKIDKEFAIKQIKETIDIINLNHEIYIIVDKKDDKVSYVTDNVSDVLLFMNTEKTISNLQTVKEYKIYNILDFLFKIVKPTNKYTSFETKYRVYKYHKTILLGNKTDKIHFSEICKNDKVKMYFRDKKLTRILE